VCVASERCGGKIGIDECRQGKVPADYCVARWCFESFQRQGGAHFKQVRRFARTRVSGRRIYVASLACSGQLDEARAELARLKELQPELSLAWIEEHVPYTARRMPQFLEGMRMAGLA
jgi:hypothetical protein